MTRVLRDVVISFVGLILFFLLKTIFGLEVEEYWNGAVQPYLNRHAWVWMASMLSVLPTFWGGAALTLLVMLLVDQALVRLKGRPKSLELTASDGVQLSHEEHRGLLDVAQKFDQTNASLIQSREDFDQSRKSLGRIEQLKRDLSESQSLAEYHKDNARKMLEAAATGSFDHEGLIDPYPAWYQNIQASNESMESARTEVNEILKRVFNAPFDFNATPRFDENPHRVTAPNIDRLPKEEFQHDYKRFYERFQRSEPVVAALPDRLKREIESEKTKLINLGNQ